MLRFALLTTLVLVLAPAAHAQETAIDGLPRSIASLDVSAAVWQKHPTCPLRIVSDSAVSGYADAARRQEGDAETCVIRFHPSTLTSNIVRWCSVMVHEVGHLLGHPHSPQTRSVMYGGTSLAPVRQCGHRFMPRRLYRLVPATWWSTVPR